MLKKLLLFGAFASQFDVDPALAQVMPKLELTNSPNQPALRIMGDLGAIYLVQSAGVLNSTSQWNDRTLLQLKGQTSVWIDPSGFSTGQRFYRALSVAAPADTNLVFIQPGTFTMGSPTSESLRDAAYETQHVVTISRGFWMGKYEVTQSEYVNVIGSNPSFFQGDPSLPIETVSWTDATNYCALRTQQEQADGMISTNLAYRLPTEAEWEYACRAGTTSAFYSGPGLHSGEANFDGHSEYDAVSGVTLNPNGIYLRSTSPVGSYTPNAWGLYDMIGNVLEWCQDWLAPYSDESVIDPQGPATALYHVVRGGTWNGGGQDCRSAFRGGDGPTDALRNTGFRVVLAIARNQ
jgi:formylglycine-generating enzyme required for sulfatase activity